MLAGCVVTAANCADALSGDNAAAAINNAHSQRMRQNMGFVKEISWQLLPDANLGLMRLIAKSRAIRTTITDISGQRLGLEIRALRHIDCSVAE
jgi:hypothetical protein